MELDHDYFEENLALLKEYHPLSWQAVIEYDGGPLGEFTACGDGNPNLLIRKEDGEEVFLHDTRTAEAELAVYYALVPEGATGVAVFIGMGLGYTPLAMLKSRRQLRHLAVFEPKIGIFIQALHARNLSSLLVDHRTTIALGPDCNVPAALDPMARALQLEDFYILKHLPSFRIAPDIYQEVHDEVYKQGNAYNTGGNTTSAYGGKFIDNRLRHLSAIHHQQLLEHIKDTFVGVPAIIVAGGPSLNKNIHLLPKAKGRAVIIAADTALPALLAHGVTPDFTSCIDMQDITLEKIVDVAVDATETSLICSSWVTHAVPKNFPARQVYWSFTAKNMEKWLNGLLGGKVLTAGAGTVAQLNFTAAHLMGCSPIIFVGQDLAFSEQESHAQHTSLTSKSEFKGFFDRQEILWVDGYGGGKVPTCRAFLGFKHHFEQVMAEAKDRKFINATEGGARLEGTEELPLQDVLTLHCKREIDVAAMIREAERHVRMPGQRRMIDELARMLKSIAGVEKDLNSLDDLLARLTEKIRALRGQGAICQNVEALPAQLQRQFLELDALNARLDKTKLWSLLDEATMEGLRQSERLSHAVKELAGQPERYLDWVAGTIDRFVLISRFRRQALFPFAQRLKHLHGYLHQELFLLKKIAKQKGEAREVVLDLLRHYFENGDHVLMEKTMAAYCLESSPSAEIFFYRGVIAAHRSQFEVMEQFFAKSVELDSCWSVRIAECRERLVCQYLGFHREWQRNDQRVALRMLFKAIRYSVESQDLRQRLNAEVDLLVRKVETELSVGTEVSEDLAQALAVWCRELMANPKLIAVLTRETGVLLHRYHGHILLAKEEFSAAVQAFSEAIVLSPQTPQLHHLLADAAFAAGDYAAGVASLERAVALDSEYAKYWETIGDYLVGDEQLDSAIIAYEKCFASLPERFDLIKKMADCYLAANQLEAAREAYRIYLSKINTNG